MARLSLWYAWLPGIWDEADGYPLRGYGPTEAVAYVHAAACVAKKIEADAETEVHARNAQDAGAPLLRFTVRLDARRESVITRLDGGEDADQPQGCEGAKSACRDQSRPRRHATRKAAR